MDAVAYSRFRKNPSEYFDRAEHEPVVITRADGRDVVLMSKAEFDSWRETVHLMSSPENARRLNEAIEETERKIARRRAAKQAA